MKLLHERLLLIFLFSLFFIDLGNVDAFRQGTEGFYLKVAKDSFEASSVLTPYYLDNPHFSKPPFITLVTYPFYLLTGPSLLFSRLSILLFSFILISLIAKFLEKEIEIPTHVTLLTFMSSFGIIKYSRIFMLEIPLSLGICLSTFYLFRLSQRSNLRTTILFLAYTLIASLAKGPISYAITGLIFCLYLAIVSRQRFLDLKKIALPIILGLILSTSWIIYEWALFGEQFLNYFLGRENLGKFTAKSYPFETVFVGFLLFSLPSLIIPVSNPRLIRKWIERIITNNFLSLMVIATLTNLILWTIPSQRSHHYAMPAVVFFLVLISDFIHYFSHNISLRWFTAVGTFFNLMLLVALIAIAYVLTPNYGLIIFGLFAIGISQYLLQKMLITQKFIAAILSCSLIWAVIGPLVYLPVIPDRLTMLNLSDVQCYYRKPLFIEEYLNTSVKVINLDQGERPTGKHFIISSHHYERFRIEQNFQIKDKWPVWRRGVKASEIFESLKTRKIDLLQEQMLLLERDI